MNPESDGNSEMGEPGDSQPKSGADWSDFEILETLGRGGMGLVYRVRQKSLNREVALKLVQPDKISSSYIKRFEQEARLTAQLLHPNVVRVYCSGTHQGMLFLALAYVEGTTFRDFLLQETPLFDRIEIMEKISRAAHFAHRQGIVHRDIKPSNILIDRRGEPFLSDFGLARSTKVEDYRLTRTGQVLGTPEYMAPEQVRGEKRLVDAASDVYSLGAVLHHAVAGRPPHTGNSSAEVLLQALESPPVPLRRIVPEIPKSLEHAVLRAMARKKSARFHDAEEFADSLRDILESGAIERGRIYRALPQPIPSRRGVGLLLPACLLLLLLASAVSWCFLRPRGESVPKTPDFFGLAVQAHEAGNCEEADRQLELCLKHSPGHREALRMRAEFFEKKGDREQMRFHWAMLLESDMPVPELMELGEKALNLGCLEDAAAFFQKVPALAPERNAALARLAQIASCRGDYRTAAECCSRIDSRETDALLGLAELHHIRGDCESALAELNRIDRAQASSLQKARELLLRAQIDWQKCTAELNGRAWLLEPRQEHPKAEASLREVERSLEAASSELGGSPESYLVDRLRAEMDMRRTALAWEKEVSPRIAESWRSFAAEIRDSALSHESRIFLSCMLARCLFRNGLLPEVVEHSKSALDEYPWVVDFHHIQAIALLKTNQTELAAECLLRSLQEDPWNFGSLENFMTILFDRLTQEEMDYFWQVVMSYVMHVYFPLERTVIRDYIRKERQERLDDYPRETPKLREVNWKSMLDTLLASGEPTVRRFAVELLSEQHRNREFLDHLSSLPNPDLPQLRDLAEALERKRTEAEMRLVKGLVLRCGISPDPNLLHEILKMGERGESILEKIVRNREESPVISLLAAHTLGSLRTLSSFEILRGMACQDDYPSNLIASAAIESMWIPIRLPNLFSKKFSPPEGWWTDPNQRLHRILLALYLDPFENAELHARWIDGEDKLVALCSAARCRASFHRLRPPLGEEKVMRRYGELMLDPDSHVRSLSLQRFCFFESERSSRSSEEHLEMCHRQWKEHGGKLIDSLLPARDREDRMAALVSLVAHRDFRVYSKSRFFEESGERARLQKLLEDIVFREDADLHMQFWSAIVLSRLDSEGKFWDILADSEKNFFVRLGALYAALNSIVTNSEAGAAAQLPQFCMKLFPWIERDLLSPPRSIHDRRFKQAMLLFNSAFQFSLFSGESSMRSLLKSPDSHMRAAAIGSLLGRGKRRDIPELRAALQEDDEKIQRAAAAALAALTLIHGTPEDLDAFCLSIRSHSLPVRRSAAFGFNFLTSKNLFMIPQFLTNVRSNDYSSYLLQLESKAQKGWERNFDCAIAVYPDPFFYVESAVVANRTGDPEKARRQLETAMRLLPQFPERRSLEGAAMVLQSNILAQRGKIDEAFRVLREASEKFPSDSRLLWASMQLHGSRGDLQQAQEYLWKIYLSNPFYLVSAVQDRFFANEKAAAFEILREIDRRYPLGRGFFTRFFPRLAEDPLLGSLMSESER